MSKITELIRENRSIRRFSQDVIPTEKDLLEMIDSARLSPSAGNLQRLLFTPVVENTSCDAVFETLAFAAYFGKWRPSESEKPTAYVIIWAQNEPDTNLAIDVGIAAQSILLTARERGFGGCIFRSINKPALVAALGKGHLVPVLVIALGKPGETVKITDSVDGNVKYYRDKNDVHCVPKKSLDDLIV